MLLRPCIPALFGAPAARAVSVVLGMWGALVAVPVAGTTPPTADGLALVVKHDWFGAQPGDGFGARVTGAGDFDGDGTADVAVSAPAAGAGRPGMVLVYSGVDGRLLAGLSGPAEEARFGEGLSAGRDLDDDGVPDLAVGAPGLGPGGPGSGAALVISGRLGQVARSVRGSADYEFLGGTVVLAPDLDGDGRGDLLIGALQGRDAADVITGSVRAVSSADGELLWVRHGEGAQDSFGYVLDTLGDLDGDGTADLAVGALAHDGGGPDAGQVMVLSGRDGSVLHDLRGGAGADRLGTAVAGLGDVDGDGVGDLAVGVPGHDAGGDSAGAVFVHSGADMAVLFGVWGRGPGDEFGNVVAGAGDVDGDGVPDLLVSALQDFNGGPGYVAVLSGRDGAVLAEVAGDAEDRGVGIALAGLGDLDGDGRAEVAVASGAGLRDGELLGRVRVLGAAREGGR